MSGGVLGAVPQILQSERSREWSLVVCAVAAAIAFMTLRGPGVVRAPGQETRETFTFVPADPVELGCRGPTSLANCRSTDASERIVPAVSIGRELLLVRGIFGAPSFVRSGTDRFSLACDVTFLETVDHAEVRFGRRAPFKPVQGAWLVSAQNCALQK